MMLRSPPWSLPLLLSLALCTAVTAAAQTPTPPSPPPEVSVDDPSLEGSMRGLAREWIAARDRAGEASASDGKDLVDLMRAQLVADEPAAALATIARIRARQTPAPAVPSYLQYELHARALLRARAEGLTFEAALAADFAALYGRLDDRTANLAKIPLVFDLERGRRAVEQARHDRPPIELVRAWQPYAAYRAMLPSLQPLLDADADRRYVREKVAIRTPAGATLSALVVRPRAAAAPQPAALLFTIYADVPRSWRNAELAASRGYASVIAFARGKVDSPDAIEPYEHEGADVNAVIDWIAKQPWSNGAVGMYSGSYDAYAQWAALKRPHPALKTIVPYVAFMPGLGLPMENNVGLTANYGWKYYVGNNRLLDDATYGDMQRWGALPERWFASGRPYREFDRVDGTPNPWFQRWLRHPSFDAYWQAKVPWGQDFARIDIPVLSITGYYDDGQISAIEYLKQHEARHRNPAHYLVIGPYGHIGAQSAFKPPVISGYAIDAVAQFDTPELTMQWFDHVLRGAPRPPLLKDRINFATMGANRWDHAPSLAALNAGARRLYLSAATTGEHRLSHARPPAGALEQRVDFADRKTSGNDYYPNPIVRRELDRSSGFVFVGEPLAAPATVAGTFSGRLLIEINKRDVDLGVTLYELTPEGEYFHLSYFLGRASYAADMSRRALLTPGRVTSVPFTRTRMVARELRAGSRLVVQVNVNKNSNAQLNHGTGKDVSDESIADAGAPLRIRWHNGSYIDVPMTTAPAAAPSTPVAAR